MRPTALILATVLCFLCGCGDGNKPPKEQPPTVPATCDGAFDTDGSGTAALRKGAGEPAAVALSSCERDAQGNVKIGGPGGCGPDVVVDQNFTGAKRLGKITINSGGKLVFPDLNDPDLKTPATLDVETAGIAINGGGLFSVGTPGCPVGYHAGAHVKITFTGDRDPSCVPSKGCDDASVKGIEVRNGGILRMYGAKGVPNPDPGAGAPSVSWTVLRASVAPAAVGATLHLAADVTKGQRPWEKEDWIVVGTSSFSPFETEFVQIADAPTADGMGGSIVVTKQPLRYAHFGSEAPTPSQLCSVEGVVKAVACNSVPGCTAPCTSAPSPLNFNDPEARNFGIDERAEVGLISRSIQLTATLPPAPAPNDEPLKPSPSLHWGGEIRVVGGDAPPQVAIVGVELEKFGKDQLGSYPIHLHMVGDAKNAPKIMANSIHHSFNKCITVHMTSNLTIEDNVCARIVGHMFYEEFGSEENISFQRNLGLGAMSNSFDIYKITTVGPSPKSMSRQDLIRAYWWTGDNLAATNDYNYDGFNIANTDDQQNPTHGSCQRPDGNGGFGLSQQPYSPAHPTECKPGEIYTEPASGFWITNPTTELIGNAIGGCQGVGRGFWWVTPPAPIMVNGEMQDLKFKPLGAFFDNRAHACYAGFYGEEEYSVASTVLVPHKGGTSTGQPIIAHMDGMTATRNRFRGVWLRPTWFVVKDGRFATNRENVSLVTSGGIDGNAPGVWALLEDSVIAGVSKNNVGRFGPCPTDNALGINTGGQFGCVDHVPPSFKICASGTAKQGQRCTADPDCCQNPADCPGSCNPTSADEVGLGYPPPSWNMFGYMLYDGPVRVYDDRFVNFRKDVSSLLTDEDNAFLKAYSASHIVATAQRCVAGVNQGKPCGLDSDCPASTCPKSPFVYEGDAALGWFQSNQSSYPTGTVTRGLSWVNTDLRHQIYTDKVSVNLEFNDGDKNTAVIDEDGTLTGYAVTDAGRCSNAQSVPCTKDDACPSGGVCVTALHPISLNNLPFNATSNSVDECFSRGQQNADFEGRDSSLISPGSMGTLEFSTLYPWKDKDNEKDVPFPGPNGDVSHTQFITFTRDDLSVGANGQPFHPAMTLHSRDGRGVWEPKVTSGFGYTLAAAPAPNFPNSTGKAGIAHIIDVGVADVVKPDISATNPFFIRLGICYTKADGSHPQDGRNFTIVRGYKSYTGGFVDPNDPELLKAWSPSACNNLDSLHTANITEPTCPGPRPDGNLNWVLTEAEMFKPDNTPDLGKFYYDKNTGMLFLWVAQDEPNPVAPSPLGSCTGDPKTDDPSCPDVAHGETYYACPIKGCHVYVIKLDDPNGYEPGPSNCAPYETYTHAPFTAQRQLVLHGTDTAVVPVPGVDTAGEPFHTPSQATDPQCKESVMRPAVSMTQQSTMAPSQFWLAPADPADGRAVLPNAPGTSPGALRQRRADTSTSIGAADDAARPFFAPPPTPTATPLPELEPMTR